jgi:serine/threonine protein phosphatase 1
LSPEEFLVPFRNIRRIFIGHSSTINWKTDRPMRAANVWNLDTGAGSGGRLTIMDVETREFWQSDLMRELYG